MWQNRGFCATTRARVFWTGEPATETVPIDSAKAARGLDCKKQWPRTRMGSNEAHYSEASHELSECRIQFKQSEKSALTS